MLPRFPQGTRNWETEWGPKGKEMEENKNSLKKNATKLATLLLVILLLQLLCQHACHFNS